jgi:hypothetical protein
MKEIDFITQEIAHLKSIIRWQSIAIYAITVAIIIILLTSK